MPELLEEKNFHPFVLPDGTVARNLADDVLLWAAHAWVSAIAYPGLTEDAGRKRRAFQAALEALHISNFEARAEQRNLNRDIRLAAVETSWAYSTFVAAWKDSKLQPLGGLATLINSAPLAEHLAAFDATSARGRLVGEVLLVLCTLVQHHDSQLRGGASIAKALEFVAARSGVKLTDARTRWRDLKPIAHMLAAAVYLEATRPADFWNSGLVACLRDLSIAAYEMQRFVTTYRAPRSTQTVIPETSLWLLPPSGIEDQVLRFEPLSNELLDDISTRFAPRR